MRVGSRRGTARAAAIAAPGRRLLSIDALRGFDMFWITGGDALARALAAWPGWHWLEHQMEHVPWEASLAVLHLRVRGQAILTAVLRYGNGTFLRV